MDDSDRFRQLMDRIPPLPEGDPHAIFDEGRRRVRRRRASAAGGTALLLLVAVALVVIPDAAPRLPSITDGPEVRDGQVPAGWVTIAAGDIAVSVPPEWEIIRRYEGFVPPEGAFLGGPCLADLYVPGGLGDEPQPEGPAAVVYDRPTDGACRSIGFAGGPPRPGLVLFGSVPEEAARIGERSERAGIGQLEVWRSEDDGHVRDLEPSGIVSYTAIELRGGLWVSHHDDPIVQRILATARPAEDGQADADGEDPGDGGTSTP